jgi:hypothetical protein
LALVQGIERLGIELPGIELPGIEQTGVELTGSNFCRLGFDPQIVRSLFVRSLVDVIKFDPGEFDPWPWYLFLTIFFALIDIFRGLGQIFCSGRKLDKLNTTLNGVFHPNGLEIVSNTEVWDIRTFHLLKTVPGLDQCKVTVQRFY